MTSYQKLAFCVKDSITILSLYNKKANHISNEEMLIHVSILFLLILSILLFKIYYRKYEKECDNELVSPSDYTLMVKGFPLKFDGQCIKAQLSMFFEKTAKKIAKEYPNQCFDVKPPFIKKINLAYNISSLSELIDSRQKLQRRQ